MVRLGLVVARFDKRGRVTEEMAERAREAAADRDAEIEHEEATLQEAIVKVQRWALEHDHPAAEWFQGGEAA